MPDGGIECSTASTAPTDGGMDAAASAGPDMPCPTGRICLQGRCYAECSGNRDCAATEMCSAGACVERTAPRVDGGGVDGGPPNLCEGVTCESPMACHPQTGACVECLDTPCPGATPVCNIAYGRCETFRPAVCAPCAMDADCMDSAGTSYGHCVMRDGSDFERVCIPDCVAGTCAAGLSCTPTDQCVPRVGSCTGYRAALELVGCNADTDCVPLGSVAAAGQCMGAVPAPDGGMPTPGICREPCGLPTDCPPTTTCTAGFCVPM